MKDLVRMQFIIKFRMQKYYNPWRSKTYSSNYKFATAFSDALNSIVNTYKEHRRELNLYVHEDFLDNEMNQVAEDYLNNTLENVEVHLVSIITYNENKNWNLIRRQGLKIK